MVRPALGVTLAFVAVAGSSGCGTICNFAGYGFYQDGKAVDDRGPTIYGGFLKDLEVANALDTGKGPRPAGVGNDPKFFVFLLADVPLSFVADTLTLPITVCWQQIRVTAKAKNAETATAKGNPPNAPGPTTASAALANSPSPDRSDEADHAAEWDPWRPAQRE